MSNKLDIRVQQLVDTLSCFSKDLSTYAKRVGEDTPNGKCYASLRDVVLEDITHLDTLRTAVQRGYLTSVADYLSGCIVYIDRSETAKYVPIYKQMTLGKQKSLLWVVTTLMSKVSKGTWGNTLIALASIAEHSSQDEGAAGVTIRADNPSEWVLVVPIMDEDGMFYDDAEIKSFTELLLYCALVNGECLILNDYAPVLYVNDFRECLKHNTASLTWEREKQYNTYVDNHDEVIVSRISAAMSDNANLVKFNNEALCELSNAVSRCESEVKDARFEVQKLDERLNATRDAIEASNRYAFVAKVIYALFVVLLLLYIKQ